MALIYEVYRNDASAEWGVAINGTIASVVAISGNGVHISSIAAYRVAAEITKRIRAGYRRTLRAKFLKLSSVDGVLNGKFVDKHPELTLAEPVVLYSVLNLADDRSALASMFELQLAKTDVRPRAIEDWLETVRKAQDYVVASASHPAFALVVADWALSNNKIVVASKGGVPTVEPRSNDRAWEHWLTPFFSKPSEIRVALEHLGWIANVLPSNEPERSVPTSNAWFSGIDDFTF